MTRINSGLGPLGPTLEERTRMAIDHPNDTRQACPACRGVPELAKICTICGGRGDVFFRDDGSGIIEIHRILENGEPNEEQYIRQMKNLDDRIGARSLFAQEDGSVKTGERNSAGTIIPACPFCKGLRSVQDPRHPGKATFITCPDCNGTGQARVISPGDRKSIADVFEEFARRCIPDTAPPVQHQEMRRAFYAGCDSFWQIMADGLDAGDDETPEDMAYMDMLHAELVEFGEKLQRGEA